MLGNRPFQKKPMVVTNGYNVALGRAGQGIFEFCVFDSGVGCVRTLGIPRINWAAVYQQGDNRNLGGKGE